MAAGFVRWFCRCIPGISIALWILVCYQALSGRIPSPLAFLFAPAAAKPRAYDWQHLTGWQVAYLAYSIAAHLCACLIFPLRLCWSVWHITDEVRNARFEAADVARPYDVDSEVASSVDDKSSQLSAPFVGGGGASTASTLTPDGPLSRIGTPKMAYFDDAPALVTHAIILPSYKEDMDTMRETLSVLASHVLARSSYDVYLAMEQRDPDAVAAAQALLASYSSAFRNMSYTMHPGDIVGEVAGKSSNVSWAARQLSNNYVEPEIRRNCVITVMDSDTHLSSNYFLLVSKAHREDADAAMSMYTLPIIFDRNAQQINPLVRTADIFWCGAGLSGLYRGSPVRIPTSVYSISMPLAGQVGGWDTGPESIGEDMHMFLKCYFATKGRARVKIIFSPASQTNVSSDARGVRGFFVNVMARYKQAMRHMWGSLDTGYAVEKGLEAMFSGKDRRAAATWLSDAEPEERLPRWINDSNLTHFTPPNLYEDMDGEPASFSKWNLVLLYHRLYEAHFLPTHLTVALVSAAVYAVWVPSAVTHPVMLWTFSFCGTLRFVGLLLTSCYLYLYESYHRLCVRYREDEMKRAGLYEGMSDGFAHRHWRANWMDYTCLPAVGVLFGTLPAVVCYVRHFFTNKLLYTVSAKPQLRKAAAADETPGLADVAEKIVSLA